MGQAHGMAGTIENAIYADKLDAEGISGRLMNRILLWDRCRTAVSDASFLFLLHDCVVAV